MRFIERANNYFIPVHRKGDVTWIGYLDKAKYLATTKTWHIPKTPLNRAILQKKGFVQIVGKKEIIPLPKKLKDKLPKNLYDIQLTALEFIFNCDGNALLAYDMGMGKTAISLLYTQIMKMKCMVIVCQASTKTQWGEQISQWVDSDFHIVYGRTVYDIPKSKYIIINYEILDDHVKTLKKIHPDMVIIDEVQFVSNPTTGRTKAFTNLAMGVGKTLALSGTPISKSPSQFFPILHILLPTVFVDYYHYTARYCDRHIGKNGWDVSGVSNVDELREHLANIMIRKRKIDSMDMPKKTLIPILFDMDDKAYKEYAEEEEKAIAEVFGKGNYLNNKKAMTYLQYLAYMGKRKMMVSWIRDFLSTGEKLVLFATNRKVVDDLCDEFGGVKYYGGMTESQKAEAKSKFLADTQLIVGNTTSMGTGLDGLQRVCSNVGVVQLPWTSTALDQSTDRLWRIGQDSDVNVYIFMAKKSIEQRIMYILDKSRKQVEQVIDGKSVEQIDLLKTLIKELTNTE